MSTKHTATLPDGTVAKRTSANRVYPFCVAVGPAPKAERIAKAEAGLNNERDYISDYTEILTYLADGGATVDDGRGWTFAVDLLPRSSASVNERQRRQRCIGFPSDQTLEGIIARHEGYVASAQARIVELEAAIAQHKAGPELVGGWYVSGWQSRLDLAVKERDTQHRNHPGREVRILESVIV